jgi:ribose 5-phosphate isomerase A
MTKQDELKKLAAEKAVKFVESGMVLGLGTGSTTKFAILKIAELIKSGVLKNIVGIPSSVQTEKIAIENGVQLTTFEKHQAIDLTIDGADEVDPNLNLIKGGGGALLREKIIAQASKAVVIIVDENKLSESLGTKWHLPIEVIPFAERVEKKYLESINGKVKTRLNPDGSKFLTDEQNIILDANFGVIKDPAQLARRIESRAGIVEHGLFIDLATKVIAAGSSGIKTLTK